jgi:hypothetical protein
MAVAKKPVPRWLQVTGMYLKVARVVRVKGDTGRCAEGVLAGELAWRVGLSLVSSEPRPDSDHLRL